MEALEQAIEGNPTRAFSFFGRWPKGELHEAAGCLWFATPIAALAYNGVLRTTRDAGVDVDARIRELTGYYLARHGQMFWLVGPSTRPPDLGQRLERHECSLLVQLTGMAADLTTLPASAPLPANVSIQEVDDPYGLRDYVDMTAARWYVRVAAVGPLHELNAWFGYGL